MKGFVDEMRAVAMKMHTKDQAREGEKEPVGPPIAAWDPSVDGYLKFLVDSKVVFDTLEHIVTVSPHPSCIERVALRQIILVADGEFKSTGLERSGQLSKDLDWFKEAGYSIPEPSIPGIAYSNYLQQLSENDPPAFICHFYNIYFAHTAGGRIIGKKVAEKIINKKVLEFYKWEGSVQQLLQNVRMKLNHVSSCWSRAEKNHCLEETEKSFEYSEEILRLILS